MTGVTLNKTTLSLAVGANETLAATVAPADATDKTVTYASDDPTIATVTPVQGKVAGVKAGTANITATTANGKTATCAVTVTSA
ncbi:Ig-like domain-containing protein [Lactococcus lactis]|uniref:Ig-like domain-containing protein n=1 Tax=Lactococcus lactis TaxID=1358 RepID=UPI0019144A2A|nr:Ig-like domain-containing protein [Lactococcus lactis]WEA56386.1 Ig-like domain-containing protein [Lactococcus lactis]